MTKARVPKGASSTDRDTSFLPSLAYKANLAITLFLINAMSMVYNVLQAIAYIFLYFPSHFLKSHVHKLRYAYRVVMEYLAVRFCGYLIVLLEIKSGMKPIFYGDLTFFKDKSAVGKNAVMISNHTSYADWVVIYCSAFRQGVGGVIRFFLKDLARILPGIGWACYLHEFFLVSKQNTKGNWNKDGQTIIDRFQSFKDSGNDIWPTIFPEGTFHDGDVPDLVERGQKFAKENGLPHLEYTLTPRTRGFISCIQSLRGHVTHVVDQTIAFTGNSDPTCPRVFCNVKPLSDESRVLPDVVDLCSFRGPQHVHIHVKITPVSELPADEEGLKQWLHNTWKEKDELLANFHKTGTFPGPTMRRDLTMFGQDMMIYYLLFWFFWMALIVYIFVSMPSWFLWYSSIVLGGGAIAGILVHQFLKDK